MMKGVMMSAILSAPNAPHAGESEPSHAAPEPGTPTDGQTGTQMVSSLVQAGRQTFASPYTVTVKKIEPIPNTNQVRVTFFVTGEDAPAHDFTETGNQVVTAFLNAGMKASMHANISGANGVTVQKIEAIEGGDDDSDDSGDDSDENSDADAPASNSDADAPASAAPTPIPPQPTSTVTPEAPAGNVPTLPAAPPITGERPTTAPSSPVQGQSQRGEHAGSEEESDHGPEQAAPPPDRS